MCKLWISASVPKLNNKITAQINKDLVKYILNRGERLLGIAGTASGLGLSGTCACGSGLALATEF
jgi:hypothetical protein